MKKAKLLKKIARLEIELANAKRLAVENLYKFPPAPNCRCVSTPVFMKEHLG